MTGTVIDEQVAGLRRNVRAFIDVITALPEERFLAKLDDAWTPRDVTAHFIGWNRASIRGIGDLRQGRMPYLHDDPGEDFAKANAFLVKEYASRDRDELVRQLEASSEELAAFMLTLDPADWDRDWGVTFEGEPRMLRNSFGPLVEDYVSHRRQIEAWAGGGPRPGSRS
jgi:hypothetical protein